MVDPSLIRNKVRELLEHLKQIHQKFALRSSGFYQDMEGFFRNNHGKDIAKIRKHCDDIQNEADELVHRLEKLVAEYSGENTHLDQTLAVLAANGKKFKADITSLQTFLPKPDFKDNSLQQRSAREWMSLQMRFDEAVAVLEKLKADMIVKLPGAEEKPALDLGAIPSGAENFYLKDERKNLELKREELQKQIGKDLDFIDLILYIQEKLKRDMEKNEDGVMKKLLKNVGDYLSNLVVKKDVNQEELRAFGKLSKDLPNLKIKHRNDKEHYFLPAILIYVSDFSAILADMREMIHARSKSDADKSAFQKLKETALPGLSSVALLEEDPEVMGSNPDKMDTLKIIKKFFDLYNVMSAFFAKVVAAQTPEIKTSFSYLSKSLADFKGAIQA